MAYVKTSFAFAGTGIALLKLIDDGFLEIVGWILVPLSLFVLVIGAVDYHRVRKSIDEEKHDGGL
ncbi:MAG: hypothetical protein COB93_02735 [Sneathiella sp.]|nr:MAG: hypothetical protein COB93_02735 [Sneathiella sp.]